MLLRRSKSGLIETLDSGAARPAAWPNRFLCVRSLSVRSGARIPRQSRPGYRRAPAARSAAATRAPMSWFAWTKTLRLGKWIRTIGPALAKGLSAVAERRSRTDKLDRSLSTGRLARRQWSAARDLSPGPSPSGGTDGSNPLPSSGEMLWGGRRGWQFRRLHQSMECRDAPAERFEQVPRAPGPR